MDPKYGEPIFTKFRWFIVIKAMKDSCICVSVQTYGGQGTNKPGTDGKHHCALVVEGQSWKPLPGEQLGLKPIHIIVEGGHVVEPESRVTFLKLYTVEYYVKVMTVGRIHSRDIRRLDRHSKVALKFSNEEDEDDDDDDDDDDED